MPDRQTKTGFATTSTVIHARVAKNKRGVCQAAARLFNSSGYREASIESISSEAGIARSTFYRFFQDKEDLVKQMVNPVFNQARERLQRLDPDKPEDIVNGIADCYLELWQEQRDELVFSADLGLKLYPLVQPAHDSYANVILALMQRVHHARMLRNDDPDLAAMMIARNAVRVLQVCETHKQFENVFRNTLRGMLLKW